MSTDIHSLVGAYVLDAVDDLERAAFERHLRDCESCRLEVAELRETVVRLADPAWSAPPPRLRDNVLAAIGRTPQLPAEPARPPQAESARPPQAAPPVRRRRLAAVAAVVVAIVGGAAGYAVQEGRVREAREDAEAARAGQGRAAEILAAADVAVRTRALAGGGQVSVALSRSQGAGVVMLAAEAAPPGGRVFQLWTLHPGEAARSAGVLAAGQQAVTQVVEGLPAAAGLGVTVEPAGGSATPTPPLAAALNFS